MVTELASIPACDLAGYVKALPARDRAEFQRKAKRASQYLRDSKQSYSKAYDIASAMVRSWWHLGRTLRDMEMGSGKYQSRLGDFANVPLLKDLGINRDQSVRCQKLSDLSADELEAWLEDKYDDETYYLPSLKTGSTHVENNSGNNEWYTPPKYIEAARAAMGGIDLDPASSNGAQKTVKAGSYFTARTNGLKKIWSGRVWLNPPYSRDLVSQFVGKLCEHIADESVSQAILLTNNSLESQWFHQVFGHASALCFPLGRIKFCDETGKPANSPLQGQVFVYCGSSVEEFIDHFHEFGVAFPCTRK